MPEPPVPTRGTGTGQEVPGGLSGLSLHPLLDLSLLFTLLLPRLPGLWVIGKINLSAQLAGSNQSLGLGCNLIPWGGGRRVELSRGSQGEGLCTPLPCLPQYVGAKMVLLLACSPLSTLKAPPHSSLGSSLSVTPQGEHPHSLILLTWCWFPLLLSWVLGGVQSHHPPGPSQSLS